MKRRCKKNDVIRSKKFAITTYSKDGYYHLPIKEISETPFLVIEVYDSATEQGPYNQYAGGYYTVIAQKMVVTKNGYEPDPIDGVKIYFSQSLDVRKESRIDPDEIEYLGKLVVVEAYKYVGDLEDSDDLDH